MGVAVFGGSFDPLHIGHLHVAESARGISWVDTVYFVPAGRPPHKRLSGSADSRTRLAIIHACIADRPYLDVLDWELSHTEPSYTFPTIERIRRETPDQEPVGLIVGTDLLQDFASWHNREALLSMVTILLTRHPTGDDPRSFLTEDYLKSVPAALRAGIQSAVVIDHVPLPVSSTVIRSRIQQGMNVRDLVPPAAWQIIQHRRLYGL